MVDDPLAFGEFACARGFLTRADLDRALAEQSAGGARPLPEILIENGTLTQPRVHAIEKLRTFLATPKGSLPDENELVGTSLGGCLLIERVGSGAVGTVYRAHHLRL